MYKLLAGQVTFKIANAVIAFINLAILARLIGPQNNGAFNLWLSNIAILVMVLDFGLAYGVTYFLSNNILNKYTFFNSGLIFTVLQIIDFCIITWVLINLFSYPFYNNFGAVLTVTLALSLLLNNLGSAYFNGLHWFKQTNYLQLLLQAMLLLFLLFCYFFKIGWLQIVFGYAFINLAGASFFIFYFYNNRNVLPNSGTVINYTHLVKFSGILFVTNIIQLIAFRSDYWFLDYYKKTDLNYYAISAKLVQAFWMVPLTIQALLVPQLKHTINNQQFKKVLQTVFIACTVISILAIILAPFIIPLFFGQEYSRAIKPFQVLMIGGCFMVLSILLSPFYISNNKKKVNFYICLIGSIIAVIGNYILIPQMGMMGAAIASTIAYTLQGLISLLWYNAINKNFA